MSRVKLALLLLAATGGMALGLASGPFASAAEAATVARSVTLEDLAQKLTDRFVDPDVGLKYAAMLRANAKAGKYDAIGDDAEFAKAVTADLQAVAFDGHLKVKVEGAPATGNSGGPSASEIKAIEAAARLTPGIAYIRIGKFFGEPEAMEAIEKFLTDNADAQTIIIDVTTHIGGGLAEMDLMFPMLFDKGQVLVGMDTRSGVRSPMGDGPTMRTIASPATVVRREHFVTPTATPVGNLRKAKVFVLASGRTGSAGEHFVLSMKRTKRATVIGETTYGAGNFGGGV
ncbi:MAG TPA: S41 family peptidase, partial [Sphingomicrobium sp.]